MIKLIAIYKQPADAAAFEAYYQGTHMPLTKKVPNIKEIRVNKIFGTPKGKSDLYLIAELCFESKATFKEAMSTKEAMESGKDTMNFAGDLVSVHFAEEFKG